MKTIKDLSEAFKKIRSEIADKIRNDIKRRVGVESVKLARENFKNQGFTTGSGTNSWQKRSDRTNRNYDKRRGVKGSVYRSGNPILRQTGKLYNSIHYEIINGVVWVGLNEKAMPYGRIHNEGGTVTRNINAGTARIFTKVKVKGSFTGLGKYKAKSKTIEIQTGSRDFKAHSRTIKMPKRQFLGMTTLHKKMIERIINEEISKIMRKKL